MMSNLRPGQAGKVSATDATFLQPVRYIVCSFRSALPLSDTPSVEQLWSMIGVANGGRIHWLARSYLLH